MGDIVSQSIRKSSSKIYNSRWEIFCVWCAERKCNPGKASEVELAYFILHLVEDKKLSVSSISGYMSAITSVRRLNNLSNLLEHPVIRDLLRAIKLQQAQKPIKSKLPLGTLLSSHVR